MDNLVRLSGPILTTPAVYGYDIVNESCVTDRHGWGMARKRLILWVGLVGVLALSACGRDDKTDASEPSDEPTGVGFLLFPNPQAQQDGTYQTNTTAYAQAYYAAIDPTNLKTTLDDWKAQNGFGGGTGTEISVVFRDVNDLGYGRRMTARLNADNTVAFFVENYSVTAVPGRSYGALNLEAAISQDRHWHVGTNAIEFSPGPNGQTFAKFFNFSSATGQRQLTANLDGKGQKAMPGICVSCHGGRGDPLNADGTFPNGGNTRARLQPLNVGTFEFAPIPGYTRVDLEASLKQINQFVLCTYPLSAATANAEDACRPVVSAAEWANYWQSTAAEMVKDWYDTNGDGAGMESTTFSDTYLPTGWVGQETLYNNVVAPYCRTCHILRGAGSNQSDIDFMTYAKFQGYADRIKTHVIDRGNMPLAFLVAQRFWNSAAGPNTLAAFLEGEGFTVRDSNGAILRAGRPIANPGVSRSIPPGSVTLSAANSLFVDRYSWSIVLPTPGTATLDGGSTSNSMTPTFNASVNGAYTIQLIVSNGTTSSDPAQLTLTVDNTILTAPSALRFSDIQTAFQTTLPCTGCHTHTASNGSGGSPPWDPNASTPPIFYTDYDRGLTVSTAGTANDGTYTVDSTDDDYWFYLALRGRINFTDPAASPLLRKPTGNHHGGLTQLSTTDAEYSVFVNWILNGAPYN